MLRAMLRDMRAHPGRIAMTLVAIVLGVTFVVATWVVSDSAAATIASSASRDDIAVQVTSQALTEVDRQRLAQLTGVSKATGVAIGYAALVKADGKIGSFIPELAGTSWDDSERFALIGGRGPVVTGEVALEEQAAVEAGLSIGSTARILDRDGNSSTATVVGVFAYRRVSLDMRTPAVAYDPATSVRLFGDRFESIELFGADEAAIAGAAQQAGYTARTGTELAAERQRTADEQAKIARSFLLTFAGVALVAGMFVIANTFTMLVAQRTRHLALLRAVGAKRRQVRRAVLAEAGVLGLIGSTIGALLGVGLGWLAMMSLRTTGEVVLVRVSPSAILVGYCVGVLVTVAAAYGSARRGAAVAPVAALGTDAALPRRSLVLRAVLGSVAMAVGVTAVVATSGGSLSEAQRVTGMGGALIAWVAVLILAPFLASAVLVPLSRLVSGRRAGWGGAVMRIAVRNAIRDPRRTAATASALMVGLALVTAFATVGASFRSFFTAGIESDLPASSVVVQSAQSWGSLPLSAVDKVREVSGVDTIAVPVEGPGVIRFEGGEDRYALTGLAPAALGTAVTPRILSGTADLERGVLVPEELAVERGIQAGDSLSLSRPSGQPFQATVSGIYAYSSVLYGVIVNEAILPPADKAHHLAAIYVSGVPRATLEAAFADRPDVVVVDRQALIRQQLDPLDLALGIIYALLAAAVIIAVFGVVNTLALSVLERTREIGVFRAVGATRRVVRRSVRRESVVIAAYGGLLGVVVGVLLGGVMQHIILTRPIFDLSVPWQVVGMALGGMVVVGVLAALWPARRAARTDVLQAIATT